MSEVIIPWNSLSEDSLLGIVEDFVSREGTDYGHQAYSLEQKVNQVLNQLHQNEAMIVFDSESETCSIIAKSDLSC